MLAVPAPISASAYVAAQQLEILAETASPEVLLQLIRIHLAIIHHERSCNNRP